MSNSSNGSGGVGGATFNTNNENTKSANKSSNKRQIKLLFKLKENYWKVQDCESFNVKDIYMFPIGGGGGSGGGGLNEKQIETIKFYSSLKHPNLISCESWFEDNKKFYLVEEAATSRNLIERLSHQIEDEEHYEEQILFWFYQILLAVNKLHENQIVHKRISQGWIVFVEDEIKLCINPYCSILRSTDTNGIAIKPCDVNFNSPECLNSGRITLKYDIWCLGWLLFNMCTLDNPFDTLNQIVDFSQMKTITLSNRFSVELNQLFYKMTEINPDRRPNIDEILKLRLFSIYRNEFGKCELNNGRYVLMKREQPTCQYSHVLQVIDLNDENKIKLIRRYLNGANANSLMTPSKTALSHPHIDCLENTFIEDDFYYTIEKPLKTGLNELLNSARNLFDSKNYPNFILSCFVKILSAVDKLHSLRIIHGNICPGMIGFDDDLVIKLKFNPKSKLVREIDESVDVGLIDLAYNSPESSEFGKINSKYDIWCLGWVLYKMLTQRDLSNELKEENRFKEYDVSNLNLEPPELDSIFKEMIELDYCKRPTARQLLEKPFIMQKCKKWIPVENENDNDESVNRNPMRKKNEQASSNHSNEKSDIDVTRIEKENTFDNRYEKVGILSSYNTNFSVSYLVNDKNENSKKKILRLFDENYKTEKLIEEIRRLVDLSRSRPHPNIVHHFAMSVVVPGRYLVVEFCDPQQNLSKVIERVKERKSRFNFHTIVCWLVLLSRAVDHLHKESFKIIHRDIQPKNIFVYENQLKLANFAFSTQIIQLLKEPQQNDLNTLRYMSPEMIRTAGKTYDTETDIWSIGCIMFELLEMRHAFGGDELKSVVTTILNGPTPVVTSHKEPDVVNYNKRLLSKSPNVRMKSSELVEGYEIFYERFCSSDV